MIEPAAFVNFVSDRTLDDLASEFSARLFGGIPFVGRDEGIWDEIPAVRLSTRFLGFEVILGGKEGATGGYSFEVVVADSVSENASTERADLSEYVAYLVGTIFGIQVI